jgi:hypothetical protein
MNATFERLHRDLGRVTALTLYVGLGFLALAVGSALAGLPDVVISFRGAAAAVAYVFAALLTLLLASSAVALLVRYATRPAAPPA